MQVPQYPCSQQVSDVDAVLAQHLHDAPVGRNREDLAGQREPDPELAFIRLHGGASLSIFERGRRTLCAAVSSVCASSSCRDVDRYRRCFALW